MSGSRAAFVLGVLATASLFRSGLAGAPPEPGGVRFTDVTAASGIAFKHEASPTTQKYLVETMGGGVAVLDYDGDGWLDVFFTNGAELQDPMPPGAEPRKASPRYANRLYRNNHDGTFADVTDKAGVAGDHGYGMGVAVGDYDNDGRPDLYVTSYGTNVLYHNEGGRFRDVTARAGVAAGGWSASAGFVDYDGDGRLDLFVTRYVDFRFEENPYCGDRRPGYREYCHPRSFKGVTDVLYHNEGGGTFKDATAAAGLAGLVGKGLGVAFADYDGDGRTDVFVANDGVPGFLLRNLGQGRFEDVALAAGVGYNEEGTAVAGMGADLADYDNDGRPDLFVSTLSGETYSLYKNRGDGGFEYATVASGLAALTLLHSGWGTRLFDYDNDGWKDLFVAQGHVLDTIELTSDHLKYAEPPLLLRGGVGRFAAVGTEAGPAFGHPWAGRGAAFGDLDNDGDTDVVVSNCGQRPYVLRNDGGNRAHWLGLSLVGTKSNRDALGAVVKTTSAAGLVQLHTVTTASSYLSASDKRVLVGLGESAAATLVEIRWPSGLVERLVDVPADRWLSVEEDSAKRLSAAPPPR
jgi:enediyne biosynthesis protein E4